MSTATSATKTKPIEEVPCLPDEFWEARDTHKHIRTAARSRIVGPDAMFGAAITRVAALTPPQIVLPAIVGSIASLNFAELIVSESGGGKTNAMNAARELLPARDRQPHEAGIGSGEGLVVAFFERTKVEPLEDADGTKRKGAARVEWHQRYQSILFTIDEGQMMKDLARRSGQTTMSVIRSMWSGTALGNSYADKDKSLRLPAHGYRAALIMGVQPEHARFLLEDDAGGTPQRFHWSHTFDIDGPDIANLPDWPGQLPFTPPTPNLQLDYADGYRRHILEVDPAIWQEVREHASLVARGLAMPDPLDSHSSLIQLKLAALLGILDGRLEINTEDWHLAKIMCVYSRKVRESLREHYTKIAQQEHDAADVRAISRAVRSAVHSADTIDDRNRRTAEKTVLDRVRKAGVDGISRRTLCEHVSSTSRDRWYDALDALLETGVIVEPERHIYRAACT